MGSTPLTHVPHPSVLALLQEHGGRQGQYYRQSASSGAREGSGVSGCVQLPGSRGLGQGFGHFCPCCPYGSVLRRLRPDWHNHRGPAWVDAEREGRGVGPGSPRPDRRALLARQGTLHTHQDSLARERAWGGPLTLTRERLRGRELREKPGARGGSHRVARRHRSGKGREEP